MFNITDIGDPLPSCPEHGYTEASARAKLSRHHKRGDHSQRAWLHEDCGQWHVTDADDYPAYLTGDACAHLWGTLGRTENFPLLDDLCHNCGRRYGDLPVSIHTVEPGLYPQVSTVDE